MVSSNEEKRLYAEYLKDQELLKKVKKQKKAVGQVFAKGILPLYVLYILSNKPTNGNDIAHIIGIRTNGRWIPSTGGIYPILNKFEKQKFIEGKWDDSEKRMQKIYTITELGKVELEERKSLLKVRIEDACEVFKIVYSDLYMK